MPSAFKIPYLDGDPREEEQQPQLAAPADPNAIPPLETPQFGMQGLPDLGQDQGRPRVVSQQQATNEGRIAEIDARQAQLNKPHLGQPGSSHSGTGGKILHGLAQTGNILGDIFAPNAMARIPGTQMHNEAEKEDLQKEENTINQQGTTNAAQSSELQSTNTQRGANTAHLNAETDILKNPPEDEHMLPIAYGHAVKAALARNEIR